MVVKSFKYLETTITNDNKVKKPVEIAYDFFILE